MPERWIAVLDDSLSRVRWLQARVPERLHVMHELTVRHFIERLTLFRSSFGCQPLAIVLDHDLGIGSFEDINGDNGMDAVRQICAQGGMGDAYLVWTTNDKARPQMVERLVAGVSGAPVAEIPFERDRLSDIEAWLRKRLEG